MTAPSTATRVPSADQTAAADRARARRRRRRARAVRAWTVVALAAVAAWVVWASPLFALEASRVEVATDESLVGASEVRAAVAPFIGVPLPRLDTGGVVVALEALPGVRRATVERAWPDGLAIMVEPRVPVAAIPGTGGFTLVDAEGLALGAATSDPGGLPIVEVEVGADHVRALAAVLSVLDSLPAALAQRVESAGAATEDTVVLGLRDGPTVEWGSADESDLKAQVVLTLLTSGAVRAGVIDVSAPTLPVLHD